MAFPWQEEAIYCVTAATEGALLVAIRRRRGLLETAVRFYLWTALGCFAVLFPMSLLPGCRVYLFAYTAATFVTFAAECGILYAIFESLRGRSGTVDSGRWWLALVAVTAVLTASCCVVSLPTAHRGAVVFWAEISGAFAHVRNCAVFLLVLYSLLASRWWSRRAALVWAGMLTYSVSDYVVSSMRIGAAFGTSALFNELPAFAGLVMFGLWARALLRSALVSDRALRVHALKSLQWTDLASEKEVPCQSPSL